MEFFSFGLARVGVGESIRVILSPLTSKRVPGLIHAECMTLMRLGARPLSRDRMQITRMSIFAAWESEDAFENFLVKHSLGRELSDGWHLRMRFLRRWGSVREFGDLPEVAQEYDPALPVAAYTLARLKIPEVPRFIKWGRPVEELVRDHPEASLPLAAIRLPRSVSTFSIWSSQKAMSDMVRGQSSVERADRHASAMQERDRRNFHKEFTTLRFEPLSEHGSWEGRSGFVRW